MTLLFGLLLAGATWVAAQSFEGTIVVTNSLTPAHQTTITLTGDQSLQKPQGPGLADVEVFTDVSEQRYHLKIVHPTQTEVIRYHLTNSARMGSTYAVTFANVAPTGQQQTIDGYLCQGYQGSADGQAFVAWVADELPASLLTRHRTSQTNDFFLYHSLPGVDGLVLSFESTFNGQAFEVRNTVTAQPVNSQLLQAPTPTTVVE